MYVESLGIIQKSNSKTNRKNDRRIHVIYENGTENTPLLNGLAASLYGRQGKIVTEPDDKFMFSGDDQATGYIYVLKSLSKNPQIQAIQEEYSLYKVGFTSNTVKKRIANVENESTYLYGPVEEVAEYQVINLDPEALETAVHHALAQYKNVNLSDMTYAAFIKDRFLKKYRADVEESTCDTHARMFNHVIDYLGEISLKKISTVKTAKDTALGF